MNETTAQPSPMQRLFHAPAALAAIIVGARIGFGLALNRALIDVIGVSGKTPIGDAIAAGAQSVPGSFLRWDANWIMYVTRGGYGGDIRLATFFPGYPAVVRILHEITGVSYEWSALLVSYASFFIAVWGVIALGRALWPDDHRNYRAGLLIAFFPSSVFLMAGYTEALFMALAAWSFAFVARKQYLPAALLAGAAAAVRPEGVLVGLATLIALLMAKRWVAAVIHGATATWGLVAFSILCWIRYGNPLAYFNAQRHWGRAATVPFRPLVDSLLSMKRGLLPDANTTVTFAINDIAILFGTIAVGWLVWSARKQRALVPFAAVAVIYALVLFSNAPAGTSPEAAARVLLCVVPMFLAVNRIKNEALWSVGLALTTGMAVVAQALFNFGYWFT